MTEEQMSQNSIILNNQQIKVGNPAPLELLEYNEDQNSENEKSVQVRSSMIDNTQPSMEQRDILQNTIHDTNQNLAQGKSSLINNQNNKYSDIDSKLEQTNYYKGIDPFFWDDIEKINRQSVGCKSRERNNKTQLNKTFTNYCWQPRMSKSPYRLSNIPTGVAIPDISCCKRSDCNILKIELDQKNQNLQGSRRSCNCSELMGGSESRNDQQKEKKLGDLYRNIRDHQNSMDLSTGGLLVQKSKNIKDKEQTLLMNETNRNFKSLNSRKTSLKKFSKSVFFGKINQNIVPNDTFSQTKLQKQKPLIFSSEMKAAQQLNLLKNDQNKLNQNMNFTQKAESAVRFLEKSRFSSSKLDQSNPSTLSGLFGSGFRPSIGKKEREKKKEDDIKSQQNQTKILTVDQIKSTLIGNIIQQKLFFDAKKANKNHLDQMKQDYEAYFKKEQDFLDNYNTNLNNTNNSQKQLIQSMDDSAKIEVAISKDNKSDQISPVSRQSEKPQMLSRFKNYAAKKQSPNDDLKMERVRSQKHANLIERKNQQLFGDKKLKKKLYQSVKDTTRQFQVLGIDPLNEPEERARNFKIGQTSNQDVPVIDISEMNEKWKRKKSTHYEVFEQLMTPMEKHKVYKEDFDKGMDVATNTIQSFARYMKYKRKMQLKTHQTTQQIGHFSTKQPPDRQKDLQKTQKSLRSSISPKNEIQEDDAIQDSEEEQIAYRQRISEFTEQLNKDKRLVRTKIYKRRFQQQVFGSYLKDLDDLVNQDITVIRKSNNQKQIPEQSAPTINNKIIHETNPSQVETHNVNQLQKFREEVAERNHSANRQRKLQDIINENENLQNEEQWVRDLKQEVFTNMEKDRQTKSKAKKRIQKFDNENAANSKQENKMTYPLQITFYEPANLAIFALVTREIQIHELMNAAGKIKFFHVQSVRVENTTICLSASKHKVNGNLLICLGTQCQKNNEKSEIVIFELDPQNNWQVTESRRWIWPPNPSPPGMETKVLRISNLFYRSGCGLVASSFQGFIEVYDTILIRNIVWNNYMSKSRSIKDCGSISAIDYSDELDIIAFGGVSGKIHFLDQTTKKYNGFIKAHNQELKLLKFYDPQHQIVSVTVNGDVGLWDSQKLIKYQVLRNKPNMIQSQISSCSFHEKAGRVVMATTKIFNYDLKIDEVTKVKVDQYDAIANDFMQEFFRELDRSGILKVPMKDGTNKIVQNMKPEMQMLKIALQENRRPTIDQMDPNFPQLVGSKKSQLVYFAIDENEGQLFVVDYDLMVRVWNLRNSRCLRSYKLQTRRDQMNELDDEQFQEQNQHGSKYQKKIHLAKADRHKRFLLICFEGGEIQMNNFFTGALIYNNFTIDTIKFEHEIANAAFFTSQTKFWVACACYDGYVSFITKPIVTQGQHHLKFQNSICSHERDVLTMAFNSDQQLVTGSSDNMICFWNQFSGKQSKKINLLDLYPNHMIKNDQKGCIKFISFPFIMQKDLMLIVLDSGHVLFLETQQERLISFKSILHDITQDDISIQPESFADVSILKLQDHSKRPSNKISSNYPSVEKRGDLSGSEEQQNLQNRQNTSGIVEANKKDKNYYAFRMTQFPIIDLQDEYLVCVASDEPLFQGHDWQQLRGPQTGYIYQLRYANDLKIAQKRNTTISRQPNILNQLNMQKKLDQLHNDFIKVKLLSTFQIDHVRGPEGKRTEGIGIHQLKVNPTLGIIISANRLGHVSIFSLSEGQKLAQVGRDCLPREFLLPSRKLVPYFREEQLKDRQAVNEENNVRETNNVEIFSEENATEDSFMVGQD